MNRIVKTFDRLRKRNEKAFIPFITLGYPDVKYTESLVLEMEARGADIVELGIPFSDPLADGPVIQAASYEALKNGINLTKAIKFVERLRHKTQIPLIFMGYYNSIFRFGEKEFVSQASEAGVDGVIVVDLPPEEAISLEGYAKKKNLATIFLLTPVSSDERIKLVSHSSQGFIYCVSYTGVTGEGKGKEELLRHLLAKVRSFSSTPVAVGFGISSPRQAKRLCQFSDALVVGSAIIRVIAENIDKKNMVEKVGEFAYSICWAIKNYKSGGHI